MALSGLASPERPQNSSLPCFTVSPWSCTVGWSLSAWKRSRATGLPLRRYQVSLMFLRSATSVKRSSSDCAVIGREPACSPCNSTATTLGSGVVHMRRSIEMILLHAPRRFRCPAGPYEVLVEVAIDLLLGEARSPGRLVHVDLADDVAE